MADTLIRIPLDQIEPDPNQARQADYDGSGPREAFALNEEGPLISGGIRDDIHGARDDASSLADSILSNGVLQPILVDEIGDGRYRIVAGERRWRAACVAKEMIDRGEAAKDVLRPDYDYGTIPAVPVQVGTRRLEMQLVENIQRIGMSARDIGKALNILLEHEDLTIRGLAQRLGKNTGWVQNMLTAASEEGFRLSHEIGSEDWHFVRRLKAAKTDHPEVYQRVIDRVRAGELFSRKMFLDEYNRARDGRKEKRDQWHAEEKQRAAELHRGQAVASSEGRPALDEDEEDLPELTPPDFKRGPLVRTAPPAERAAPPATPLRLPRESDAAWLIRTASANYTAAIEMGELDESLEVTPDLAQRKEREPEVDILVRLPRSRAEALAGLVEGLLSSKRLPTPHRIEGETGRAIAHRIERLLEKAGG